jgi:hypothetical protein
MQFVHTVFVRVAFHWRAITPLVGVFCRSFFGWRCTCFGSPLIFLVYENHTCLDDGGGA